MFYDSSSFQVSNPMHTYLFQLIDVIDFVAVTV